MLAPVVPFMTRAHNRAGVPIPDVVLGQWNDGDVVAPGQHAFGIVHLRSSNL